MDNSCPTSDTVWQEFGTASLDRIREILSKYSVPQDSRWLDYDLLTDALRNQRKEVIELLLAQGCRVNKPAKDKVIGTPLYYAVVLGDEDIIDNLLKKGASITAQNFNNETPLHKAAFLKNEKILDLLLARIKDSEFSNPVNNFGLSHMLVACMGNDSSIVEYFLKNEVDVNANVQFNSQEWPGYTALHFAVEYAKTSTVKLLLEQKNLELDAKEERGLTPLNLLCRQSFEKVCNLIDIFLTSKLSKKLNLHRLTDKEQVCIIDRIANQAEQIEILRLLLAAGSDVNSMDKFDRTPLVNACQKIDPIIRSVIEYHPWLLEGVLRHYNKRRKEIVEILVATGEADVRLRYHEDDTILHLLPDFDFDAATQEEMVELFMSRGADVNAKNKFNETPLFIATRHDNVNLVEIFLKRQAEVNCYESANQSTPLHLATTYKFKRIIDLLLTWGADVGAKQWDGRTPLHTLQIVIGHPDEETLVEEFYRDVIGRFLEREGNGDVDVTDQHEMTPLHVACQEGNRESVQVLLEFGADINREDRTRRTPLFYALNDSYYAVKNHIEKLMSIKFYVSRKNVSHYLKLLMDEVKKWEEDDFLNHCKYEIVKLKNLKIDSYTSLYDVLYKDANEMSYHIENQKFDEILRSDDFRSEFPLYGYLIELQFKRGQARKALLKPAKEALESMIKTGLPDSCSENIFKYLCDESLKELIKAKVSGQSSP